MKKRLSDDRLILATISLAVLSLIVVFSYGLRVVTLESSFGVVPAEIPVIPKRLQDPSFHNFEETSEKALGPKTPAVVLTTEALYFGDLEAFTSKISEKTNKYYLHHVDGEPQLFNLLENMNEWLVDRSNKKIPDSSVIVFIPTGDIPVPIVIQVIAGLKKAENFKRIIIGTGLL